MMPLDWFAGMAMQSLLNRFPPPEYSCSTTAAMAYIVADAMVAEREKRVSIPQSKSVTCDYEGERPIGMNTVSVARTKQRRLRR